LTTDQANEFAKRQVRLDIGRQGAEAISKSALSDAKFEGDYARIMTAATPAGVAPAPADGAALPGATPAPAVEGAAPTTETPGGETQKDQPKN
jgi:hypothetical protein